MSDKKSRNRSFINLAIVAGVILLGLLIGKLTDNYDLAVQILKALGLVMLGITILVTIHELGHFLTAKMFGMRAETFAIGFPPKLFSFTKGETEYMFGAIPLGGFVKISGIIDESLDTEHLNEVPEPYEFRAKPVWQRLIVMTGGVIMNVILGVAIFWGFKFSFGDRYLPMEEVQHGIYTVEYQVVPDSTEEGVRLDTLETLGHFLGFRTGDKLISMNGETYPHFEDYLDRKRLIDDDAHYIVERDGQQIRIEVPGNIQNYFSGGDKFPFLFQNRSVSRIKLGRRVDQNTYAETLIDTMPAVLAGLQDGDHVYMLDSTQITWYQELQEYVADHESGPIMVHLIRGGDSLSIPVTPNDKGQIGVLPDTRYQKVEYSFFEAFVPGVKKAFGFLTANAQGLTNLFTRKGIEKSKSVMGPIQIAKQYLLAFEVGGMVKFLELTAMLSMILALVNILPIPALDGGHVVFLLIEAITRKEPSPKVRIIAQQIGMVLILGLMIVIFGNDIFRLFQ
ncbi:MAG: RIP metalloprotease RseP [Bacteroidota bacterium]